MGRWSVVLIKPGGETPVNILKKFDFSFDEMTICANHALINDTFPSILKNANVTTVHKKDDPYSWAPY